MYKGYLKFITDQSAFCSYRLANRTYFTPFEVKVYKGSKILFDITEREHNEIDRLLKER